jgi:hypothetical protein
MPRLDGPTSRPTTSAAIIRLTGARIAGLGATEYTLVDIEVDMSTSVGPFRGDLIMMIETVIDACRKSPRSDNLLVRVAASAPFTRRASARSTATSRCRDRQCGLSEHPDRRQ